MPKVTQNFQGSIFRRKMSADPDLSCRAGGCVASATVIKGHGEIPQPTLHQSWFLTQMAEAWVFTQQGYKQNPTEGLLLTKETQLCLENPGHRSKGHCDIMNLAARAMKGNCKFFPRFFPAPLCFSHKLNHLVQWNMFHFRRLRACFHCF